LLAFALPAAMQGFTHTIALQVLTGLYAKSFGLSLAALGSAVLLCKVFDAAIDPLIGVASDAAHRRSGSRKSWVLGGSLLTALALWFLLRPEPGVGIVYFTLWFLAVYAGWTITEIPYRAWSAELTQDYVDRTRIAVWVLVLSLLGAIAVFVVPLAMQALGHAATPEFTLQTLAVCALITGVALPAFSIVAVKRVPDGVATTERGGERWHEIVTSIIRNRPLLLLNLMFLLQALSAGMCNGVAFLYFDVYMGLGQKLAVLLLITVPIAVFAAPVWGWLCGRFEKHRAWAFAVGANGVAIALVPLVQPGPDAFAPMAVLLLLNFFFGAAAGVAVPAMLGDVVDYGRLKFGRDRAGTYYAFYALIQKAVTGVGMALGLLILDRFAFKASGGAQTAAGTFGVQLAYAYLPALLLLVIVPLLLRYPITRSRHAQILRELEGRGE
jgi:Na+/melibiose symporter-like transporter